MSGQTMDELLVYLCHTCQPSLIIACKLSGSCEAWTLGKGGVPQPGPQ